MTDFIALINQELDRLDQYDLKAAPIAGLSNHWVLIDGKEVTVFSSPKDCWCALTLVEMEGGGEPFIAMWWALLPNYCDGILVLEEKGIWYQEIPF